MGEQRLSRLRLLYKLFLYKLHTSRGEQGSRRCRGQVRHALGGLSKRQGQADADKVRGVERGASAGGLER